jgi:hypothetical protein
VGNKVIEKITDKVIDKVENKIDEAITNKSSIDRYSRGNYQEFNVIDYKRDYSRSNVYADINYRDNFKGDRELLARAGFIYYIK